MTYGDYFKKHNNGVINIHDDTNTIDDFKVFSAIDSMRASHLTNEQIRKFLSKETDSLDNFYNDFATYIDVELKAK